MNNDERSAKRLRRRIAKLLEEHPTEVAEVLLETPFWPEGLETNVRYARRSDDDRSYVSVACSPDGDTWPDVFHVEVEPDPESRGTPRFRTYFGGGESLRTRNALLMLAKAILMDNTDRPQRR